MGRPLNKKYFGKRNPSATGTFGNTSLLPTDYDLGGSRVTGFTVGTAGTYTSAVTATFPAPALSAEGATTATGTINFTPVAGQITVGGTATVAYLSTDILTQATTNVKYTPTLATVSGNTITNTNGTSVTVTSGTYIQGTSFITGGTVTTTSGLAINTTYYVAATTSASTTVTLAATYALAIAGTAITFTGGSTAISNGSVTIGTVAGAVTSAVWLSGTVLGAGITTSALAVTGSGSSGAGNTIAVAQWGIYSANITNSGNGYLPATVGTTYIKATPATISSTISSSTISKGILTTTFSSGTAISNGAILTGGSVTAGTYIQYQLTSTAAAAVSPTWVSGGQVGTNTITLSAGTSVAVGQLVAGTGLAAGTTVTAISGANATVSNLFTAQAAGTYNFYTYGGSGTYQLGINGTNGVPLVANDTNISNAGAPTGAAANLITVTSTADITTGMRFTPARAFGNLVAGTTYYVIAVISNTQFVVGSSVGATSAFAQTVTAAPTIGGTVTVAANGALSGFTSVTTALAAGTPVVITSDTSGFITNGTYYVAASPAATTTSMTLVTTPNGTTTATTTAGNANGTFTYYPAAPFGQNLAVTFSSGTGAATTTLQAQVSTGYAGMYTAMQAIAITVGEVARSDSDIVKQENTQRFRVENQDGLAFCKLITSYPTSPGTMAIQATDSTGSTYWVTKITNRRCVVTRQGTTGEFASGARVNWTFGVLNTSVKIDNA